MNDGSLDKKYIEAAAKHVIEQKLRFNSLYRGDPWGVVQSSSKMSTNPATPASIETNTTHEDLAEEAAIKSAVLLKNGDTAPVLPLPATTTTAPGS